MTNLLFIKLFEIQRTFRLNICHEYSHEKCIAKKKYKSILFHMNLSFDNFVKMYIDLWLLKDSLMILHNFGNGCSASTLKTTSVYLLMNKKNYLNFFFFFVKYNMIKFILLSKHLFKPII